MSDGSDIKKGLRASLRELVALHGVSGFEQPLVAYFRERVAGLADQVEVDRYGNVTALKRGRHDRPRLMLSAHLDEIGFIVKGVEPSGFLRFDRLGGTADALLLSRRVWVNGHFGLIGSKAGHLQSGAEQARAVSATDLYIDVGAASAAEVADLGIRVGDPVTFIGELAKDEKLFATAYEAFRSGDAQKFQAAFQRLRLTPRCRLVCEWIRSKECVFLCLELCGPPKPLERAPNPRELAEAIVRITSDKKLVRELAAAVEKRNRAAFERIIAGHKLQALCHLFCHWLCIVRYRLFCRVLCAPGPVERPNLGAELHSAGQALSRLLENKTAMEEAVAASNAGDAEKLGSVIRHVAPIQFCHYICEWLCSWRCTLACLTLCRQAPAVKIENQIKEAHAFAAALQQLSAQPAEMERLSAAVGAGDAKIYTAIIGELKWQRFCIQFCHWVCALRCRRFCILVCPPRPNHPWFTHVGDFGIAADIDPATGLTNKAQGGHGGPSFGLFGSLSLRGFCPKYYDPAQTQSMAYRFLYKAVGAVTATPITGGFVPVASVLVGTRYTLWNGNPSSLQTIRIRGTGTTSLTPPPPGPGRCAPRASSLMRSASSPRTTTARRSRTSAPSCTNRSARCRRPSGRQRQRRSICFETTFERGRNTPRRGRDPSFGGAGGSCEGGRGS